MITYFKFHGPQNIKDSITYMELYILSLKKLLEKYNINFLEFCHIILEGLKYKLNIFRQISFDEKMLARLSEIHNIIADKPFMEEQIRSYFSIEYLFCISENVQVYGPDFYRVFYESNLDFISIVIFKYKLSFNQVVEHLKFDVDKEKMSHKVLWLLYILKNHSEISYEVKRR